MKAFLEWVGRPSFAGKMLFQIELLFLSEKGRRQQNSKRQGQVDLMSRCLGTFGKSIIRLADVIVVDSKGRPIGRVWLTVIIDVATRMVVAFYIGLDPPSRIRVATAVDLAVSRKSNWLAARGLTYAWPPEGLPLLLHSDRAAEFRSLSTQRAVRNEGTGWELRPPGRTRYGGHVERLIGTLMGKCRIIPGATHRNPLARGKYDSKASARLRIDELELYFAHQILGVYHQTKHSELGISPLEAWTAKAHGREPRFPEDMKTFRLNLLPEIKSMIGRRGIKAFSDEYYSPALGDAYILGAREVIAKYDPRDLSRLYVQIPGRGYLEVPYRLQREGPAPTLWLLNAARRGVRPLEPIARNPNVRQGVERAEAIINAAAARSGPAARQVERLRLERQAVADLRVIPAPPLTDDDDWGGAFGGGEPIEPRDSLLDGAQFDDPAMLARVFRVLDDSGSAEALERRLRLRWAVRDVIDALRTNMRAPNSGVLSSLLESPLLQRRSPTGSNHMPQDCWADIDAAARLLYVRLALLVLAEPGDPVLSEKISPLGRNWLLFSYRHTKIKGWQALFEHAAQDLMFLLPMELPRNAILQIDERSLAWPRDLRRRWTYAAAAGAIGGYVY